MGVASNLFSSPCVKSANARRGGGKLGDVTRSGDSTLVVRKGSDERRGARARNSESAVPELAHRSKP